MKKLIALVLLASSLGACSYLKTAYQAVTTPASLSDVRKSALSVDYAYKGALDLANTYAALPACTGTNVICSDPAVVKKLVDLDAKAQPVLDAMNKTVQDPKADVSVANAAVIAAQNAVDAFKAALPPPTIPAN